MLVPIGELLEHHIIPCRSYWRLGQRMPSTFAELWSDQWDRTSTMDETPNSWDPTVLHAGFHLLLSRVQFWHPWSHQQSCAPGSHKLVKLWRIGQGGNDFPRSIMVACTTRPLFICALSLYQCEDGSGPSIAEQLGTHPQARCCNWGVLSDVVI